jgi:zinc-ribbon domain
MNFCPQCGARLTAQAKFCAQCGNRVSGDDISDTSAKSRKSRPTVDTAPTANSTTKNDTANLPDYTKKVREQLIAASWAFMKREDHFSGSSRDMKREIKEFREILEAACIDDEEEFRDICEAGFELGLEVDETSSFYLYRRAKWVTQKQPGFWSSLFSESSLENEINFKDVLLAFESDAKMFAAFQRKTKPLRLRFSINLSH